MRVVCLLIGLFLAGMGKAHAQTDAHGSLCKVIYSHVPLSYHLNRSSWSSNVRVQPVESRFAFSGNLAIYYFNPGETDLLSKKQRAGKKLINHANFYDFSHETVYHEIINQHVKEQKVLLKDTIRPDHQWTLLDTNKNILGYDCRLALHIGAKQDSILAWYTTGLSLKRSFAPFDGLPGLVLEVYDRAKGEYIKARKIKWSDQLLEFPTGFRQVTKEEWKEMYKQSPVMYGKRKVHTRQF